MFNPKEKKCYYCGKQYNIIIVDDETIINCCSVEQYYFHDNDVLYISFYNEQSNCIEIRDDETVLFNHNCCIMKINNVLEISNPQDHLNYLLKLSLLE